MYIGLYHNTNPYKVLQQLCDKGFPALGHELSLPWASKLTPARLPTGSNRPWVSRSKDGILVLKP